MKAQYHFNTVSRVGFCDYGNLVETPHGLYTVFEAEVGSDPVEQECFYNYTKEAGPDGRAMSSCIGHVMWDIDGQECITRITSLFQNISRVMSCCCCVCVCACVCALFVIMLYKIIHISKLFRLKSLLKMSVKLWVNSVMLLVK